MVVLSNDDVSVVKTALEVSCEFIGIFECLQCFDAVGWAAGRASGL